MQYFVVGGGASIDPPTYNKYNIVRNREQHQILNLYHYLKEIKLGEMKSLLLIQLTLMIILQKYKELGIE